MSASSTPRCYRFGIFEADAATGELRRKGRRIRIAAQPFQMLLLLLDEPGALVTREQICQTLWPEGTFVDFEHGVNSAANRLREALGDVASNPRFIETLARRGYRFLAPVEVLEDGASVHAPKVNGKEAAATPLRGILATPDQLPRSPRRVVLTLFALLQLMYLGFYVGSLANLAEIEDLLSPLPHADALYLLLVATAAALIPVRAFMLSIALFHAPAARAKLLRLWLFVVGFDVLWALSPFLLLHHINAGLALACATLLVYAPFAERSLVLMGAAEKQAA